MAGKTKTARFHDTGFRGGDSVAVQDHETDSPILPIDQIERLRKLNPAYSKAFIDQAEKQADFLRKEKERESRRDSINKLVGRVSALLVGLSGLALGGFIVYTKPGTFYAGTIIATASATGLAIAFIRGRKQRGI